MYNLLAMAYSLWLFLWLNGLSRTFFIFIFGYFVIETVPKPKVTFKCAGMNSEDSSKSADDGAKGVNISSSVSTSVENRQDNVHAKSDNEQGIQTIINQKYAD